MRWSSSSAGGHCALLAAVSSQTSAYAPVDEIDKTVPVMGSLIVFNRLLKMNVAVQLQVVTRRGHGFADVLYPRLPPSDWRKQVMDWLRTVGMIGN